MSDKPKPPVTNNEPEWKKKARLDAVFGDTRLDSTSDDRDEGESGTSEAWLKRQVPPHHV